MQMIPLLVVFGVCVMGQTESIAQPPRPSGERGGRSVTDVNALVKRMLTLDANGDGQLSKAEVKDSRLQSLFERADADNNGVLTPEEMTTFFTKEVAALQSAERERPDNGPDGFGPPPDARRPGGPGGPRSRRPGSPPPGSSRPGPPQ